MSTWVSATFRHLAARVGGPEAASVAEWLSLCERAGMTPVNGPLAHDLVLPRRGRAQLGINVFGHGRWSALVREQATRFARTLGGSAGAAVARLAGDARDATWSGGFLFADGNLTLKLYLSASADVARALGLHHPRAFAYGVDVGPAGLSRARAYQRIDHIEADDAWRWPAWSRWNVLADPPGHSHRVLTSLADEKRTLNHIFGPQAEMASLSALASAVARLDPECPSCLDEAALAELDTLATSLGAVLRPVAYEIDLFVDGNRQTDALVTLAAPPG